MGEYKHTEDMGEISGFGGGYEATCQDQYRECYCAAQIDGLATAASLLRRIYEASEINDDAVTYITSERFPLLHNELASVAGNLERTIASGIKQPSRNTRIGDLEQALRELIAIASECDSWESFPAAHLDAAQAVLDA